MASSRSLLHKDPHYRKKLYKRPGAPSKLDKALVAQVVSVAEVTTPVTTQQVTALTKVLGRSRASIKKMVEDAKENFVEAAGDYVQIHKEATANALATGDNETATKAAQWAMTNMSFDGARIVDKAEALSTGTKIMIGLKLGGLNPAVGVKVDD